MTVVAFPRLYKSLRARAFRTQAQPQVDLVLTQRAAVGITSALPTSGSVVMNALRFQMVEDRIASARIAVRDLHAALLGDASTIIPLHRTSEDLEEAIRLFHDAHLLFVKIENLLAVVEWKIERLFTTQRFNGSNS